MENKLIYHGKKSEICHSDTEIIDALFDIIDMTSDTIYALVVQFIRTVVDFIAHRSTNIC